MARPPENEREDDTSTTLGGWVYRAGSALLAVGFILKLLDGDSTFSSVCLGVGGVVGLAAMVVAVVHAERGAGGS